ncbi:MAG: MFS transporter [Candidatus Paceibacterota bacterium]|jgi:MFS family permease
MEKQSGERNVLLYWLYVVFNEPLFWGPVVIASLQKLAHMRLSEIYYMESAVVCICVVLDIPFGSLADLIGRKKCIIIGRIFLFGSATFFALMTAPIHAWVGNVLWAIGLTMQNGADTALLSDTLNKNGKGNDYRRVQGRAIGSRYILIAFCSLLTGSFAGINLRLPVLLGLPFMLISLFTAFFFEEPARTERYSAGEHLDRLKQGISFVIHSVEVRWMIGFAALLATTSKVWFFTYNPYFELVGLPLTQYGVIFFCLNMVAWWSSTYAYKIEQYLGERACIVGMILCIGIPILLMGCLPFQPLAYLVIVQNVVRGFMSPFVGGYVNRHLTITIRATGLSAQSSIANVMAIVGLSAFGFFTNTLGLLHSLVLLGIAALVIGMLSYATYARKIA